MHAGRTWKGLGILAILTLALSSCAGSRQRQPEDLRWIGPDFDEVTAPAPAGASREIADIRRCLHADEDHPGLLTADSRAALRLRLAWLELQLRDLAGAAGDLEAFGRLTPAPRLEAQALSRYIAGELERARGDEDGARRQWEAAGRLAPGPRLAAVLDDRLGGRRPVPGLETGATPTRPDTTGLLELEDQGALSVLRRGTWGSRAAVPSRLDPMGHIFRLTIHHSAMVVGEDRREAADQIRSIQRRHIGANHWGDIGYHFLIARDGSVFEGRELEWQGAHAGDGRTNRGNVGICLLGQYKADEPGAQLPTRAQVRALVQLTCSLCEHYEIGPEGILTHREIHPTHATECPGEQVSALVKRLRTELRLRNRAE